MHSFYCPHMHDQAHADHLASKPILSDQTLYLDADESHHAARVLRLKQGQEVTLFDGQGFSAAAMVQSVHKSQVIVSVIQGKYTPPATPQLWIAAAVAKGGRPDDMVDQLCQVNAAGWIPLIAARSVVDPRQSKIEKLRRTAIASAKQCGRSHLLQITEPMSLKEALAEPAAVRLWASTHSDDQLESALPVKLAAAGQEKVLVYIGPEGGWTREEEQQAVDANAIRWSLGQSVMRIETAAVAAAAVGMYLGKLPRD